MPLSNPQNVKPTITVAQDGTGDYNGTTNTIIQTAIDFVHSKGGGVVYIKAGEYILNNQIILKNNVEIRGDGRSTILTDEISTSLGDESRMLLGKGVQNIVIRDLQLKYDGTIKGNKSGGFIATSIAEGGDTSTDEDTDWSKHILIDNVFGNSVKQETTNNLHFGFIFRYTSFVTIKNCEIYGVDYGTEFERAYDCSFTENKVRTNDYGVMGGTIRLKRFIIANNNFRPSGTSGGQGIRIEGGEEVIIANNTFLNWTGYGAIQLSASGSSGCIKFSITGNTFQNCKRFIECNNQSRHITIANNIFLQNRDLEGLNTYGLVFNGNAIGDACSYVTISNNQFRGTTENPVNIGNGCENLIFTGNYVQSAINQEFAGTDFFVSTSNNSRNIIFNGNIFEGVLRNGGFNHAVFKVNGTGHENWTIVNNFFHFCDGSITFSSGLFRSNSTSNTMKNLIVENNIMKEYIPPPNEYDWLLTINVAPAVDWEVGDIITGQSSGATSEVVLKVDNENYQIIKRKGTYTDGEIIGVTGNADKLADQNAGAPTYTDNREFSTSNGIFNGIAHNGIVTNYRIRNNLLLGNVNISNGNSTGIAYHNYNLGTDALAEQWLNGNFKINSIDELQEDAGVTIDGVLIKDGEVAGRDISADGNKLDGIDDNANDYTLPEATDLILGGVKQGSRVTITAGVISADDQSYTLPEATDSVLGGVIVGSGISVTSGTISADDQTGTSAKISTGTDAPTTTPAKAGDIFVDTTNGNIYIAKGTADSTDWVQVNN